MWLHDRHPQAFERPFRGVSHGLRIEIFATKKFFAIWALTSHRRSPDADSRSNRMRLIRGGTARPTPHIAKHHERSVSVRRLHRPPHATSMRRLKRRVWISGDR